MKKKLFLLVLAGALFAGCHSDLDLSNVDTTSRIDMGLALNVGTIRATLGDFIGDAPGLYIDSMNGGVITWRGSFPDKRPYHEFDMKDHISSRDLNLNVYDKIQAAVYIGEDSKVIGNGSQMVLTFDFPIKLKDINKELGKERLDSALIDDARFTSVIDTMDLPLEWSWIDEVELVLGEQVTRAAGNTMKVYERGKKGGYGQRINTDVDNFSICLMKDRTLSVEKNSYMEYEQNVIDSANFQIRFKFTIPTGKEVHIPSTASFKYHLEVEFIDFTALWGFFEPSNQMSADQHIDLSDAWTSLEFLKNMNVPFSDPKVDILVHTKLAGAMMMKGNFLYTIKANGDTTWATFDEAGSRSRRAIPMSPYLHPDPKINPLGDSVQMTVQFNKDIDKGHIDHLFSHMPQAMGYNFEVYFDTRETPQIRIPKKTDVAIDAHCTLPLKFKDGLFVFYTDTIRNVDLSSLSIDSLIHQSNYIDTLQASDIHIYLKAQSEIPMTVKLAMKYMDEQGNLLMDPMDSTKAFNPFQEDTIRIAPPRYERATDGNWFPAETGNTIMTVAMNKAQLDMFPKVKRIVYTVSIDNEALNEAFKKGLYDVAITTEQHLSIGVGLTAHVDAILNFNNKENKK